MNHSAQINDWLWVGDCESCPQFAGGHVVHIFRTDGPSQERLCVHEGRANLRMNYQDGDEISPSNLRNLDAFLAALPARGTRLLIHCHAGACRSPTVAVYALATAREIDPFEAHARVAREIHRQCGKVVNVPHRPLKQIVQLWESSRESRRP